MSNGKDRITSTLDPENVEYLDSQDKSRSAIINELVTRERKSANQSALEQLQEQLESIDEDIEQLQAQLEEKQAERDRIEKQIEEVKERNSQQQEEVYAAARYAKGVVPEKQEADTWSKTIEGTGLTPEQFQYLVEDISLGHYKEQGKPDSLPDDTKSEIDDWLDANI